MSLVELLVYAALFSFALLFMSHFLWAARHAERGRTRLTIYQDLRLSSAKVNQALAYATEILFPPPDGKAYHQLVFVSNLGQLHVVFLDQADHLFMLNYDEHKKNGQTPVVLAKRTLEFKVTRPVGARDFVQYYARMMDDQNKEFVLSDGISIKNLLR